MDLHRHLALLCVCVSEREKNFMYKCTYVIDDLLPILELGIYDTNDRDDPLPLQ